MRVLLTTVIYHSLLQADEAVVDHEQIRKLSLK